MPTPERRPPARLRDAAPRAPLTFHFGLLSLPYPQRTAHAVRTQRRVGLQARRDPRRGRFRRRTRQLPQVSRPGRRQRWRRLSHPLFLRALPARHSDRLGGVDHGPLRRKEGAARRPDDHGRHRQGTCRPLPRRARRAHPARRLHVLRVHRDVDVRVLPQVSHRRHRHRAAARASPSRRRRQPASTRASPAPPPMAPCSRAIPCSP